MTYFGPTRAEMKFRLFTSILALALIAMAFVIRGLPGEAQHMALATFAMAFLTGSALLSMARLRKWDDG